MKVCFKCHQAKPITEFYKHPMMLDGHLGKCKECTKRDVKEHRRKNIERVLDYDRQRTKRPERRAKKRIYHARYNQRHPDRAAAHYEVSNAIRDGRLARQPCEVCGDPAEAHHEDYSKPLDVQWLCFKHHRQRAHGQLQYLNE